MKRRSSKCAVCGGKLTRKIIKYDQHWGDKIVIFEDVPARTCLACGEIWLGSKVVEAMDMILKQQKKPKRIMSIPVWSLSSLKAA